MESLKRSASSHFALWLGVPLCVFLFALGLDLSVAVPLDTKVEADLLSRVEAKHNLFPTYVWGKSKTGNPVIYKPSVSGLRDFRKYSVLQTDSYMIDLWLKETGAGAFTLVLDLSALRNRMRSPTADMWSTLRTVSGPQSPSAQQTIERLVAGVFPRCEAIVVINANTVVRFLRPFINLMIPVHNAKIYLSNDSSALSSVVDPSQVPRPYNPRSTVDLESNPQTLQLYELLNARASQVLGRPLDVDIARAGGLLAPAAEAPAVEPPAADSKPTPGPSGATPSTADGEEEEDAFDDID